MPGVQELQQVLAAKGLCVQTGEAMLPAGVSTLGGEVARVWEMAAPHGEAAGLGAALGRTNRMTDVPMGAAAPLAAPLAWPLDLPAGVHEWFYTSVSRADVPAGSTSARRDFWHPPLMLMAAGAALRVRRAARGVRSVLWIGRRCWPTLTLLRDTQGPESAVLQRNILLDPLTDADRVWAIEQALRAGVAAVIADGSGFTRPMSRRIQLAAEAGRNVALLARPEWEISEPSFAAARWQVEPVLTEHWEPRWQVSLLHGTGSLRAAGWKSEDGTEHIHGRWMLEWISEVDRGTSSVRISAVVGSGTGAGRGETRMAS